MGQKVSPTGLRIGINKDWESRWMAPKKDFAKYLNDDIKIRDYLEKNLKDAGVSKIEIERNNKKCEVIIHTSKPGIIIGRGGEEIKVLKDKLSKLVKYNVSVSIMDVKNIDLNATLVAQSIAKQIEARAPFRAAQKKAIRAAMKAGAKGIKTLVSGRLNGVEMARSEGYSEGNVPLHTIRADIDYADYYSIDAYFNGPNVNVNKYDQSTGDYPIFVGTITPDPLTEAEKRALEEEFHDSWYNHIVDGECENGFNCANIAWPTQ